MNRAPLIGLTALAMAALSCDLGGLGVAPAAPEPTPPPPIPKATAEPTPPPPTVAPKPTPPPPSPTEEPPPPEVFVERFDSNRNDWFEGSVGEAQVFVGNGVYNILNPYEEDVDNFVFGVTRAFRFEDFDLTVDLTQLSGTEDNEMGVVLGYEDDLNFYEFAISGDGFAGIFQIANGEWDIIEAFFPSGHIVQGNATNQIRLVVEGANLTAFVNGERVLEKPIPGYRGGFVGLGCGAFEPPEVSCTFDNLEVTEL